MTAKKKQVCYKKSKIRQVAQMCLSVAWLMNIVRLSAKGTCRPTQLHSWRNCVRALLKCFSGLFQDYFYEHSSLVTTGELKDAPWLLNSLILALCLLIQNTVLCSSTRLRSIAAHSINSAEFTTVSCHAGLCHRKPQTRLCSLFTSGFVSLLFARVQLTT